MVVSRSASAARTSQARMAASRPLPGDVTQLDCSSASEIDPMSTSTRSKASLSCRRQPANRSRISPDTVNRERDASGTTVRRSSTDSTIVSHSEVFSGRASTVSQPMPITRPSRVANCGAAKSASTRATFAPDLASRRASTSANVVAPAPRASPATAITLRPRAASAINSWASSSACGPTRSIRASIWLRPGEVVDLERGARGET